VYHGSYFDAPELKPTGSEKKEEPLKSNVCKLETSPLASAQTVKIGPAPASERTAIGVEMSEFQLWNEVRSSEILNQERWQRKGMLPGRRFHLPLNGTDPVPSAKATFV